MGDKLPGPITGFSVTGKKLRIPYHLFLFFSITFLKQNKKDLQSKSLVNFTAVFCVWMKWTRMVFGMLLLVTIVHIYSICCMPDIVRCFTNVFNPHMNPLKVAAIIPFDS